MSTRRQRNEFVIVEGMEMLNFNCMGLRRWTLALAASGLLGFVAAAPAVAQTRGLPDFTELVEQVGPSVVNIRTLEKVAARPRGGSGNGIDEDMLEFFRRFGVPIPNIQRQQPGPL